jgi:hypothetical protein
MVICGTISDKELIQRFVERVSFYFDKNLPCISGGETPTGFDCRGLALLAIRDVTGKNNNDPLCGL